MRIPRSKPPVYQDGADKFFNTAIEEIRVKSVIKVNYTIHKNVCSHSDFMVEIYNTRTKVDLYLIASDYEMFKVQRFIALVKKTVKHLTYNSINQI